ncbi:MAG: hypothetical protein AAF511_01670 [Pseudomonadota bacterium]
MLSLIRAFLVGALIALAVPVAIAVTTMSGMAGPRYQVVDLLPFISPLVAVLLLLAGLLATLLQRIVRLSRGFGDGLSGTMVAGSAIFYGAGMHIFADLNLGAPLLTIIGGIVAILSGVLAFVRWQLSGRPSP